MRDYGGLGIPAAAGVFVLFFFVLALYWGLFSFIAGYFWRARWGPLAVPFLWVAIEFARAHLVLSGFPWLLLGYALTDYFAVSRFARWTGVYGLSYLLAAINVALVWVLTQRGKWSGVYLAVTLAVPLLLFVTYSPEIYQEDQKAFLVQTNIPEVAASEAWDLPTQAPLLNRLQTLTVGAVGRQEPPSLVIWPETPSPFYLDDNSFSRPYAEGIARQTHSYFLMGTVAFVLGSNHELPLNSQVLFDPAGSLVSQYDKIHLVPFGEYVPLKQWLGFAGKLTAEVSDFVPGSRYVVTQLPDGRMSGMICYEAIFPELARRFVKDGAEVLVNTSNDGWYGSSAARNQHLLMARMRAIENRRYVLRATNTGMTAIIRPDGRITSQLPPDQPGVLEGKWAYVQSQMFYSRYGDWFAILSCIVSILACVGVWCDLERN